MPRQSVFAANEIYVTIAPIAHVGKKGPPLCPMGPQPISLQPLLGGRIADPIRRAMPSIVKPSATSCASSAWLSPFLGLRSALSHTQIISAASDRKFRRSLPPDALGARYAFDQGGAVAAEGGAALVLVPFSGGGDLGLEPALLQQEVVELHCLG